MGVISERVVAEHGEKEEEKKKAVEAVCDEGLEKKSSIFRNYKSFCVYMYLPIELQKYILSFLRKQPEFIIRSKGRCICYTKNYQTQGPTRCKKKVNYLYRLTCSVHHFDIPELFCHIKTIEDQHKENSN